jgi:hypothetical protein
MRGSWWYKYKYKYEYKYKLQRTDRHSLATIFGPLRLTVCDVAVPKLERYKT